MCLIAQTLDNALRHEDYFFNVVKNKVIYELIYTPIVMKENGRATSLCQQSLLSSQKVFNQVLR